MIRGLYTAASSMNSLETKTNIRSNNLANANTTAFKKSEALTKSFPEVMLNKIKASESDEEIGEISSGAFIEETFKDLRQGALNKTENNLDFAIRGQGYFVVGTDNGRRYSRDGNFTINSNSELVTQTGNPVLDENGNNIQLIPGQDFRVNADGQITFNNGLQGAEIALVNFADPQNVEQEGDNLYTPNENAQIVDSDANISQGYLETSNVKIVEEMAKMIKTTRHYESNQKVIRGIDDSLSKVINEVGKA